MTKTLDAAAITNSPRDASDTATAWLDRLTAALGVGDIEAATALFATESY